MVDISNSLAAGVNAFFAAVGFCLCIVGAIAVYSMVCAVVTGICSFFDDDDGEGTE